MGGLKVVVYRNMVVGLPLEGKGTEKRLREVVVREGEDLEHL